MTVPVKIRQIGLAITYDCLDRLRSLLPSIGGFVVGEFCRSGLFVEGFFVVAGVLSWGFCPYPFRLAHRQNWKLIQKL